MKKTNKNILKAAALTTVAATLTVAALPVNAETINEDVTKNEDVFVVLNSDGSINTTTVSDTLHSDSGFSNYDDKSNLTNGQNLKSVDAMKKSSDGYTWNTDAKDIYYQGTYSGNLPLGVSASYTLNGKSISEEDLLGQSGHVVITLDLTNNKYKFYNVNGKTYQVAMPIVAVTGAMLNKDIFSNVSVNEGKVTSDSAHDIVATVSLPGMKDSLENIVTINALSSIEAYLTDKVVIEADVNTYETPEIMLAASTNIAELKTELGRTDLSAIWGDMDQLQNATQQLVDGTKTLYDGADALSNGAAPLDAGAKKLADGATSLETGANQLSDGASTLESGLGKLSSNSGTLNAGAKQIEDALFASATKYLNSKTGGNYTLTPTNYSDIFSALIGIIPSDRDAAFNTVAAAIRSDKTNPAAAYLNDEQIKALIYLTVTNHKQDTTLDLTTELPLQSPKLLVAKNIQTIMEDVTTKASTGTSFYDIAVNDSNVDINTYLDSVAKKLTAASGKNQSKQDAYTYVWNTYCSTLTEGQYVTLLLYAQKYEDMKSSDALTLAGNDLTTAGEVQTALTNIQTSAGSAVVNGVLDGIVSSNSGNLTELTQSEAQLTGVVGFVEGLNSYTVGVDQAYDGSHSLAAGASQLSKGASSLAVGASQLTTGIDTLSTGINTLRDGAKTLMDGMQQYDTEGISKLTDSTEVSDIKNATLLLKQIKQDSENYNNYSGISEGTTGTVKFVYKIKTAKIEKNDNTASTNSDITHVNDGSNIWSRIINLLVFWK